MAKFDAQTFEAVQNLVFPLIDTLFDFNPADTVSEQAVHFENVGTALGELSELFLVAAEALGDGILTAEEIGSVIDQAGSVMEAVQEIAAEFDGPAEEDV